VEIRVTPEYVCDGNLASDTIQLTYQVSGDKDGPVIGP
jgi:hypothetical protein